MSPGRVRDRLRGLLWQLRGVLRPGTVERELDEEHRFHIEMEAERLVREGVPPKEARRRALVAFGGVERYQEEVREARWTRHLEAAARDGRLALRALARRPLFAAVAIGTLAVAIAASTTFFSVVDAVLLRPLAVPGADRLVTVRAATSLGGSTVSLADYVDYRAAAAGTLELAGHHLSDITLSGDGGAAEAALGMEVSRDYFGVLRVRPAVGRFFSGEAVDRAEAPTEVVISHALWRGRFGGDSAVVGRMLRVNGQPLTIVGVAPKGFHGAMLGARPAVWLPIGLYGRLQGRDVERRTSTQWVRLFGRLAPDATPDRAAAVLDQAARRLAAEYDYPSAVEPTGAVVEPFSTLPSHQRDAAARFTVVLLAASAVLLLIAAVNVAGMLLARAARRGREMGVRLAIGAGRGRLARQLVVEGLVLGGLAAAAGLALALATTRLLAGIAPPGAPGFRLDLSLDGPVLAFAFAAAFAASLVFGLVPAWHATRSDLAGAIRRGSGTRAGTRGRGALLAGQVALTLVLLVSTGLLLRTLRNALATDHGFDPRGIVLAELNLRLNGYDAGRGRAFHDALLERLAASPPIASAALATTYPLSGEWDQTRASVPGVEPPDDGGWVVGWAAVSDGYFETLGFPLVAGTGPSDDAAPPRIVVNGALAALFRPAPGDAGAAAAPTGAPPVGRRFRFGVGEAEVAGVAPTGKYRSLSEEPRLFAWRPLDYSPTVYVLARPAGGGAAGLGPAVAELRAAVAALDPNVPLIGVRTLESAMGATLFLQRAAAALIGAFAVVALLLSATGIFGLLAYTVEQRRREIGVRIALGAAGAGVVRAVVGSGLRPVIVGIALGLAGALAATRILGGLLYDVPPHDPATFTAAAAVLLAAALAAAWLPARRATRVDPARALGAE